MICILFICINDQPVATFKIHLQNNKEHIKTFRYRDKRYTDCINLKMSSEWIDDFDEEEQEIQEPKKTNIKKRKDFDGGFQKASSVNNNKIIIIIIKNRNLRTVAVVTAAAMLKRCS